MQEENITRAIVVVSGGMTPSAKQVLRFYFIYFYLYQIFCTLIFQALQDLMPKYILEQFLEAELMINITEHEVLARKLFINIIHLIFLFMLYFLFMSFCFFSWSQNML